VIIHQGAWAIVQLTSKCGHNPKKLQNIPSHMNCIWHLLGHWIDLHKPPQTIGFPHQVTQGFPSPKTFQFVYNWKDGF